MIIHTHTHPHLSLSPAAELECEAGDPSAGLPSDALPEHLNLAEIIPDHVDSPRQSVFDSPRLASKAAVMNVLGRPESPELLSLGASAAAGLLLDSPRYRQRLTPVMGHRPVSRMKETRDGPEEDY